MKNVLLIIDWQKGFINTNSKKVNKYIYSLAEDYQWDYIYQAMWFNSGDVNSLVLKNVNYEDCKIQDKDASLQKLFPGAYVIPRVDCYSCITDEFRSMMKYDWHVYVCGLETDACVLASAFSLFDSRMNFNIVSEAVSSKTDSIDQAARLVIRRQFGRGSIISIDDIKVPKKPKFRLW